MHAAPAAAVKIAILMLPESGTMAPYGLHEVLAAAEHPRALRPCLVAGKAHAYQAASGVHVTPQQDLTDEPFDVAIICDIHLAPDATPDGRWSHEIAWVRRQLERGALVCSACSGALLLAEAGLLDGADAASHWVLADVFRDRYPAVRFHPERILCDSGQGGRLVTTGGAASWQDLALYLIARFCGAVEAARVARLYLLGDRADGQLPFAAMPRPRQHDDAVIADVQSWLASHYEIPRPVMAMAERSGLPERSFKRRFRTATGYAPVEYVQALRIEEAKQMLEREDLPIDDIAFGVGYEDPAFFRKLFKRRAGVTPAEYRRRHRVRRLPA